MSRLEAELCSVRVLVSVGLFALAPAIASAQSGTLQGKICDPDPNTAAIEPISPGDPLSCEADILWAQPNVNAPYAILITSAIDSVPPTNPPVGTTMAIKQPTITGIADVPGEQAVSGNAVCSGAACDPVTGANCSLPCLICGAGRTDSVGALQCPGVIGNGEINFHDDSPAPTPTEEQCIAATPEVPFVPIQDQVTWVVNNDCDPLIPGQPCNETPNVKQEVGSSFINCPGTCPYVSIDKTCESVKENGDCSGDVTVTVDNLDDGQPYRASATNCVVTDTFDGNPTPLFEADGVTPAPASFDLAPGESRVFKATVGPFTQTLDNVANIVCDAPTLPPEEGALCRSEHTDTAACTCGNRDNYKCYAVKPVPRTPRFPATIVGLEDQFRTTSARLLAPYEFCNPVDKNGEGIENPDAHLLCYKFLDRSRNASVPVEVTDQFGTEDLRTSSAKVLCVPALKNCDPQTETCDIGTLEETLNHFQCYGALPLLAGQTLLTPDPVTLADQFTDGISNFSEARRRQLCTPTAKNGGSVPNEDEHLKCYNIKDEVPFLGTDINVIDQFGTWDLRVGQARELCESAQKTRLDRRPVDDTRSRSRRGP